MAELTKSLTDTLAFTEVMDFFNRSHDPAGGTGVRRLGSCLLYTSPSPRDS